MTDHPYFKFRTASEALPTLAHAVMASEEVGSRNGRTSELLHSHIALTDPLRREIVTPLRKASLPAQIAETMWVLAGRNDIDWLSHYLPRAADFSDDGETWRGGYGPRVRDWNNELDQLVCTANLLRRDPATRRAVIAIYDPAIDSASEGKDVPCNDLLHFVSRLGKLDLHVATRSNDLMWGWSGINAFEWSVLLEVMAKLVGMQVGELHFSITSLHVYDRHFAKAQRIARLDPVTYMGRPAKASPRFSLTSVEALTLEMQKWFQTEHVIRRQDPADDVLVRDLIDGQQDPMFKSWLQVIAWWWRHDETFLDALIGTDLYVAALQSPGRPKPKEPVFEKTTAPGFSMAVFTEYVSKLHAEKHAAYGNSWKRRGEQVGILANIARKVDRMGKNGGGDDPADTAIDLLCYLIKYRLWLHEHTKAPWSWGFSLLKWEPVPSDTDGAVTALLECLPGDPHIVAGAMGDPKLVRMLEVALEQDFEAVERGAEASDPDRVGFVDDMIRNAHVLAFAMWAQRESWKTANQNRSWKGYGE